MNGNAKATRTWTARAIIGEIAAGTISAREAVDAYIRTIEEVNPALNAMVVPLFDQARKDASAVDEKRRRGEPLGRLAGLPFTVKESFDVAGTPTTLGLPKYARHRAMHDAYPVSRLRQAGAILLGKTNVSQLLLANESANPVYGRTRNPWDTERSPGGSSGGEAALIAAGGSPLGLGSDIGGSVRLPAHSCGVHAIKPTSQRLAAVGHAALYPGQEAILAQPGLIARHVTDLELALQSLSTPEQTGADATVPPLGPPRQSERDVRNLRIAMYTSNAVMETAPAVRRAVREAAAALAARGAQVEEWNPPETAEAWAAFLGILMADGLAATRRRAGIFSVTRSVRKIYLSGALPHWLLSGVAAPLLKALGQSQLASTVRALGHLSTDRYWQLLEWRKGYRTRFLDALGSFDAIICPPDALPALRHGSSDYLACALSYSAIYNLLGMPAGVVAATRVRPDEESERNPGLDLVEHLARRCENHSAGLPIGVQVAARHWREDVVFSVMNVLEEHFRSTPDYPEWPDALQ
jgi:fatty acid amide hydrolase